MISEQPTATLLLRGPYQTEESSIFSNSKQYEDADLPALDVKAVREDLEFTLRSIR